MKRIAILMAIGLAVGMIPTMAEAASFKLIVHKSNPVDSISKSELADLFLKKTTRWQNGRSVTPIDQSDRNSIREEFSGSVLGKDVSSVKSYWQRMIFSGRATPPAELATDAEVIDFVRSNAEAIGYISSGASTGADVKIIDVTN